MATETRNIDGEDVLFNTELGGAVLHHKDPARVEAGRKAAKTAKEHETASHHDAAPVLVEEPAPTS